MIGQSNKKKKEITYDQAPNLEEVGDELYGLGADLLPGIGRVHEGGVLDLLVDVLILVEWEGAGERDVNDDTRAPHVQGPGDSQAAELLESFFCSNKRAPIQTVATLAVIKTVPSLDLQIQNQEMCSL